MDDLEECGDFGVFCSLLSVYLHRRVRCLAMDEDLPTFRLSPSFTRRYSFELAFQCRRFKVNQHHIAEVMPVLLNNGQSASQGKLSRRWMTVVRRSTLAIDQRWCHNMGWAYFMTDWSPEATTNYQNTLRRPKTLFMCCLSHCWRLSFILLFFHSSRLGDKGGTP